MVPPVRISLRIRNHGLSESEFSWISEAVKEEGWWVNNHT
jgi:hypothetical protein